MSTTEQSSFDLVLARPNNYRDVNAIGDDLNAGKTVILNLEMVKQEDATRILDFLSGVAYANDDEIKMMAQKTYAIMPATVNFSGVDLVSELENNGYNFLMKKRSRFWGIFPTRTGYSQTRLPIKCVQRRRDTAIHTRFFSARAGRSWRERCWLRSSMKTSHFLEDTMAQTERSWAFSVNIRCRRRKISL